VLPSGRGKTFHSIRIKAFCREKPFQKKMPVCTKKSPGKKRGGRGKQSLCFISGQHEDKQRLGGRGKVIPLIRTKKKKKKKTKKTQKDLGVQTD